MKDLSPRQREILALVAAGRTSKEIAGDLGISESTVNWHLSNVFERLGASSRAEAVAIAMREPVEGDAVGAEGSPPRARASLPASEIALAFVLTLLLGLIGGALIAEWDRTAPPTPLSPASAAPSSGASQTAAPTARPLVGGRDAGTDAVPEVNDPTPSTVGSKPAHESLVPTLLAVRPILQTAGPPVGPNELPIVGPLPVLPDPAQPPASAHPSRLRSLP